MSTEQNLEAFKAKYGEFKCCPGMEKLIGAGLITISTENVDEKGWGYCVTLKGEKAEFWVPYCPCCGVHIFNVMVPKGRCKNPDCPPEKNHILESMKVLLKGEDLILQDLTQKTLSIIRPTPENIDKLSEMFYAGVTNRRYLWEVLGEPYKCIEHDELFQSSPEGPWCPKCDPDRPSRFAAEEGGPYK